MRKLIFILFIALPFISFSQQMKIKYANDLYNSFAYIDASEVYEDLYKKGKLTDNELIIKMAESFYLTKEFQKAYEYYSISNDKLRLVSNHYNNFIDCLLRLNKMDLLELFLKDNDSYGVSSKNIKDYRKKLLKDSSRYKLNEWDFNSIVGDYSGHLFEGKIYFSSNRDNIGYTQKKYPWDGMNYSKVYEYDTLKKSIKLVDAAASKYHDGPICFNSALGKVYLTRTEFIKGSNEKKVKLYESLIKKDSKGNYDFNWELSQFNGDYNIGHVSFSEDYTTIYFSSDMPGGKGGSDIYYAEYENGTWTEPINLKSINTPGDEMFPNIEENTLYFSSNGLYGFGGLDVYKYELGSSKTPINLGYGVNSNGDDFSFSYLSKNRYILSSDRNGGVDNLYLVEQNKFNGTLFIVPKKSFKDIVINDDIELWLINRSSLDSTLIVKEDGEYKMPIESYNDYIVSGRIKDYELTAPLYLNTDYMDENEIITQNIYFDQMKYDITVKTINKETGEAIGNVTGFFENPMTGEKIRYTTDANGLARVNIDNETTYNVSATKKGYLDLNELIESDGDVLIELDMKMIEIKKDIKFEIKNILYDLDKWALRDSSKIELDKLADFLKLNDNIKVELSSHTDSRGSDNYNQKLSQRRAQSCVTYLIDKGVDAANIIAKGYGETQLLNECSNGVECSEDDHQANRRTEIKILNVN